MGFIMWFTSCISVAVMILVNLTNSTKTSLRQELLENITRDYDGTIPPDFDSTTPVTSIVQLYLIDINSISDSSTDYFVGMFLRQSWEDSRLMYNSHLDIDFLEIDTKMMHKIWIPDVYFLNEKTSVGHSVTVPNKLMHIYPSGRVYYSIRISGVFGCQMDLAKFPLDKQICSLRLESYGYTTSTLKLRWNTLPAEKDQKLTTPQFDLGEINTYICDTLYAGVNYTCINMTLELTRKNGYYIIQVIVPSLLIIALSWVSFWLHIDAVPARISLGILTVLTMTTQSSGARASLPPVSYVKAIDVWMSAAILFVFAAVVEYACINVLAREDTNKIGTVKGRKNAVVAFKHETKPTSVNNNDTKGSAKRDTAQQLDNISRIAFPVSFVIFNIIFWIVYTF